MVVRSLHESDDQLELYSLDRLSDDAVERVEEHLIVCSECAVRLESLGAFALTMRQALRATPPMRAPRCASWFEGWQLRFALGGAIAFALILGLVAYRQGSHPALASVATLTLSAMRGPSAVVAPSREFDLTLADASGTGFTVEVVDATGKGVWSGKARPQGPSAHARINRELPVGSYFVRLKTSSGDLLHEYGFEVR